jgi:PKD repeat protein
MRSKLAAIGLMALMIVSTVPFLSNPEKAGPGVPAMMLTGSSNENFTYRPQYLEVETPITEPESTFSTMEGFETAWGKVGFSDDYWFFQDLEINGVDISESDIWDPQIEYWYVNDTGKAGRIFAYYWEDCDWRLLLNDSQFLVAQKSAEAPHFWSGTTKEWNITVRICVNKDEPIFMIDYWLKVLNETSEIDQFIFAGYPYTDGYDNATEYVSRHTTTQAKPGYCFAEIGPKSSNWGSGSTQTYWGVMDMKCHMKGSYGEYLHGANAWTLAETETEALSWADRVGSSWNRFVPSPDAMNLVVANNSEKYDLWTYVEGTDFSYIPSETSEVVYANGDWSNASFSENQIDNYRRDWTMTHVDDYEPSLPLNDGSDVNWVAAKAREYDHPLTLFVNLAYFNDSEVDALVDMSRESNGVLFDMADHNWNHSSWNDYWTYEYAMTLLTLNYNRWYNHTGNYSESMLSHGTPGTSFGNETVWAMAEFGMKTLRTRLYIEDTEMTRLYNGTMLIYNLNTYIDPAPGNLTDWINRSNAVGYHNVVWHTATEMNEPSEKTDWEAYLSAMENQSDLMPITALQFYDLYRGLLNYSTIDGNGHIDLTDCSDSHKVFMKPNAYGKFPVFMDDSTGEITTMKTNGDYAWFYAEKNHTYTEVLTFDASIEAEIEIYTYSPSIATENQVVAAWKVRATSGTVSFTVPGLYATKKYMVRVDGTAGSQYMPDAAGNVNFTYSGPWSEHTFSLYVYFDGGAEGDQLIADFSWVLSGTKAKFYDDSNGLNIVGWSWDFGDGSASTLQDPTHNYRESGSYYVKLTVVDAQGLTDSTTKLVSVGEPDELFGVGPVQLIIALGLILAGLLVVIISRRPSGAIVGIAAIVIALGMLLCG